jgi:trans-2,3-dihydro-3-hydroxyanthranilate isomerase
MQAIATDLGFSETVFIDRGAGDPPLVRIFTPADELPFAGHPLVGAAWALNAGGPVTTDRLRYRLGEALVRREGDLTWVGVPLTGEIAPAGDVAEFAAAAGISPVERLDRVMLPLEYVVVRVPSPEVVEALRPDMGVLSQRFGTLVYARRAERVRARFFAPATAVPEDPATGSAAVALAVTLLAAGERSGRLSVDQGAEIGHPSRIELAWGEGRAEIGGTVTRDEVRLLQA